MASRQSSPTGVKKATIASNEDKEKTVAIVNGIQELKYYESILQDSVRASVVFVDSPGPEAIDEKTALDGLPIVGQETVTLEIEDLNDNKLSFKNDNALYVNKVTPITDTSTKSMVLLDLVSKEHILNEKVRLNKRYNGLISEHVKTILTDDNLLGTKKNVEVEQTIQNYNFIGNNKKSYYTINWLAMRSVSAENQEIGKTAGYFFYETSEGFFFKSIDGLLSQEKKKSFIYNESPDKDGQVPAGYDEKVLAYTKDNRIDIQKKLMQGAYSSRVVVFDPFTNYYEVLTPVAEPTKTAGIKLPKLNPEFNREGKNKEYSRTTYMLLDRGTLPDGSTDDQIEKSGEENFKPKDTLNQAIMRYNQLFASGVEVTIAGDFSLHAGDVVFVDAPELKTDTTNDEPNKQSGGLYIIADLCHYISPKGTYTKLNLCRDSFGRKGNHSSN